MNLRLVAAALAAVAVLTGCGDTPRPDIEPADEPRLSVETVESNTARRGGWRIVEVGDAYRCVMFKSWEFGGGLWCEALE